MADADILNMYNRKNFLTLPKKEGNMKTPITTYSMYELRYNDGFINTHPEVIKQVKLMQKRLKYYHCFNDLEANGTYDNVTHNAVLLKKRRLNLPLNDRCDATLWRYLLDEEVSIIPKPLDGLTLPKNITSLISIPITEIENLLAKLIAIPIIDKLNEAQISVLLCFAFYFGYDYGLTDFEALNTALKLNQIKSMPAVLALFKNGKQNDFISYLCNLWMS